MTAARPTRLLPISLIVIAAVFAALHVGAIFTESINWDEFALFQRVANMLRTGELQGGGHPGAIELILAPFVQGCSDAVATIQRARLLWAVVLGAGVVGLYRLMILLRRERECPAQGAVLAVGVFVLALPFLRWSIQVRTDQLSLTLGLWGGVLLLASRSRRGVALLAGICLGLGYLCTQKVVYLAALCAMLSLAEIWAGRVPLRAELPQFAARALLCAIGFGVVFGLYRTALPLVVAPATPLAFERGVGIMEHYRKVFGWELYRGMLWALKPQLVLIAMLAVATARAVAVRAPCRPLVVGWAAIGLGALVALFHAAMFPYFWLTLGVFLAVGIGYCAEEAASVIPSRVRGWAAFGLGASLALPAFFYSLALLEDTQQTQRSALHFADEEFGPDQYGFQLEGALFCRVDPKPFPVLFRVHIEERFSGANADQAIERFIDQFRTKPVSFILVSHMMPFFPKAIRSFWAEHYQPYFGSVRVAGSRLQGDPQVEKRFSLLVHGRYRWLALGTDRAAALMIDGERIEPGGTIDLAAGEHRAAFLQPTDGVVVLAMARRPTDAGGGPFYARGAIREIVGGDYWSP